LEALTPGDLELKDGCAVVLSRDADGANGGATSERGCPSDLRGAKYATSKVTLNAKLLESWDQGFDGEGKQVWGARNGPYVLTKSLCGLENF
jgi:hypothetical protein